MPTKPTWNLKPPKPATTAELEAFIAEGADSVPPIMGAGNAPAHAPKATPAKRRQKTTAKPKGLLARADGREVRRVVVYLPPELYRRTRVHCAETEADVSAFVTEAIASKLGASVP